VKEEERILAFIGSTFRSVWAIEVLRFLAGRPETWHEPTQLIDLLRVSKVVISQSVDQLSAVALVIVDGEGRICFHPADAELARLAADAIALYERRPDQVRRTIISYTAPGIAAFSDAFKLRKD
jgi:hypothetical protein